MIYLDNAATTLQKPACVGETMLKAMQHAGNASRGVNEASLTASRIVENARTELAEFFGFSHPHRVCFTQNATESLNTVISGMFDPGDHVITTAMEHNSVLRPLERLRQEQQVEVTVLPADSYGRISLTELERLIQNNTRAVVLQHASNVTGNVNDLQAVGEICRRHAVYLVVDAAQTVGTVPIHMEKWGIDVLCFTGHKGLLGPQGTGGILVGESVQIRPLKEGGSGSHSFDKRQPEVYPEHLEAGTLNVPGIAGLLAAVRYICQSGQEKLFLQEELAAKAFYRYVRQIPHVVLYGDYSSWDRENPYTDGKTEAQMPKAEDRQKISRGGQKNGTEYRHMPERTGIVSLNIEGYSSAEVADELMERFGIATRSGAHCAPLAHKALGTVQQGIVRFSFSPFTTLEEVLTAAKAVEILACE